jgi:hypothetical protein
MRAVLMVLALAVGPIFCLGRSGRRYRRSIVPDLEEPWRPLARQPWNRSRPVLQATLSYRFQNEG